MECVRVGTEREFANAWSAGGSAYTCLARHKLRAVCIF
jgi:hypothetical protein